MSSVIKVNSCVYSRLGYGRTNNTNSFYMNGKFTSEHHIDNVQASMENRGSEYLFAVSDNMIVDDPGEDTNVSILKEIGRYHEKITVNEGDIDSKAKEFEARINDTERLLESILEMNKIPVTDSRWHLGFSGLLLSDSQFVALSGGKGHIFMMREGMFRPLASETTKAKRMIDAKIYESDEPDEIELPDGENKGSIIVSDIYDLQEGDSFVLLSDGLMEALGEEKVEDLLSLRSDSGYIAFRLVDEAMKRKSSGDLTALVVQVERIFEGQGAPKRVPSPKQTQQAMKAKVDKLNKAPAVTYKYNKRSSSKYQSIIFVTLVILTVLVLFGFLYLIINSLMNTGKNNLPSPPPSTSASVTPTPGETGIPTDEPTEEPTTEPTNTPEETPTPTPNAGEIINHVVKSGESINSIARKYYGNTDLVGKLCTYNNISDPNKIKIDQVIKVPPKDVLLAQ